MYMYIYAQYTVHANMSNNGFHLHVLYLTSTCNLELALAINFQEIANMLRKLTCTYMYMYTYTCLIAIVQYMFIQLYVHVHTCICTCMCNMQFNKLCTNEKEQESKEPCMYNVSKLTCTVHVLENIF